MSKMATITLKQEDKAMFNRLKSEYFLASNLEKPPTDAEFMAVLLEKSQTKQ